MVRPKSASTVEVADVRRVGRGLETIGDLIARVRGEQGTSQLRLAARLCAAAGTSTVTRHEVPRWERGDRIPTAYRRAWLAVALNRPVDEEEPAPDASRRRRVGPAAGWPSHWVEQSPGVYVQVA
jgi:transcriptional regulator with XRE-family HTH domain